MKREAKTLFICQQCGKESLKWLGRCPNCQAWNSFTEQTVNLSTTRSHSSNTSAPQELSTLECGEVDRFSTGIEEFNRVVGGGLVPGSLVLIGGEPGIGKSTLLLQIASLATRYRDNVMYVSGEETSNQIKLRARRLDIGGSKLFLLSETNLEDILEKLEQASPGMVIIDSIQTIFLPGLDTSPGSVNQVRECTMRLMQWAKLSGVPVLLAGHVTKEGSIAGPRLLEHIVDVVLYLEGEKFNTYRLLRCVKNRFGTTNEIGVFEMKEQGMVEVSNPSSVFLHARSEGIIGSAVISTLEGSRPLLVEIQALTNPTSFGLPRRVTNGIDFGRLLMIIAVLSRRAGLKLGNQDVIANATGGLKITEPSADLGIALAIASSLRDEPVATDLISIGEMGLSGEIRNVPQVEKRLTEAARLGFTRALLPKNNVTIKMAENMELIPVRNIKDALAAGLG